MSTVAGCTPALVPLEPRPPLLEFPRGGIPPATTASAPTALDRAYLRDNPLMVPVTGVEPARIRNSFNEPRSGGRMHQAFDIPAARGTPVVAAASGRILAMRENQLGGITLYVVDRGGRFAHYYAHLDRYANGVREGMDIRQGQVIGYVGTTGNAPRNAPHLHFQVLRVDRRRRDWWNGPAVDVREFFALAGRSL